MLQHLCSACQVGGLLSSFVVESCTGAVHNATRHWWIVGCVHAWQDRVYAIAWFGRGLSRNLMCTSRAQELDEAEVEEARRRRQQYEDDDKEMCAHACWPLMLFTLYQ